MKSVAFYTLGCKVNQYETDAMNGLFKQAGYEIKQFNEIADIYIINTCTVTNVADRKSRQILHRAKKKNPDSVVAAVGCYVQAAKESIENDHYIDLVIGNNMKKNIVSIIENYIETNEGYESIIDINDTNEYETLAIDRVSEHTRAYIKIQDGCNQFCSYCIIPYARGRVRSRRPDEIYSEVKNLVRNGYKEIVLTGIHISSYGFDFDGDEYNSKKNDEHFILLIEALSDIDGLERIRLGSLEPRIVTEAFAARLKETKKVCEHFHLSLQSGCNETLKRMNRRYTTEEYTAGCNILRKYFNNPAITTDIIVGFPGETEQEFECTKNFVQSIKFADIHVFPYSKRKGTKAAVMSGQVQDSLKAGRSKEMLGITKQLKAQYIHSKIKDELQILIEERIIIDGNEYETGHSREYIRVALKPSAGGVNAIRSGSIRHQINEDLMFCESID